MTKKSIDDFVSLAVCEHADRRGFGLTAAAVRHACSAGNASLVAIRPPHDEPGFPHMYEKGSWLQAMMLDPAALNAAVATFRPELIHIHGIWTGALRHVRPLQAQGISVVISPHGMLDPTLLSRSRLKKFLVNQWFHHDAIERADGIHVLTEHEAGQVGSYLGHTHPGIRQIPNGVDCPTARPMQSTTHSPRRFLFCGRLHPSKRIPLLLDAWNAAGLHPAVELVIAGDGKDSYAQRLRDRANATPGVRLLGYVSGSAKDAAFKDSDLGILTGECEGQSLSLLESLAYGKPCIITPGCRYPAVRQLGLGWEGENVAALAEAMRTAATLSETEYAAMSQRCYQHVIVEHDWRKIGKRMQKWYQELVAARRARAQVS